MKSGCDTMATTPTENKYLKIIDDYIGREDIARHNSNLIYSHAAMVGIISGEVIKDYWFSRVYGDYARALHDEGWIYIHNTSVLGAYCSGWSTRDLCIRGLECTEPNAPAYSPPKHIESLLGEAANFIATISQEIHGACAMNDIISCVASYLYIEETINNVPVTAKRLENIWQTFFCEINLAWRCGNSPFTNITMTIQGNDPNLRDEKVAYGGKYLDFTYGQIPQEYYDRTNTAYINAFAAGDRYGKPYTFPLITVQIFDSTDYDHPIFKMLLEKMDPWGGVYIDNYCTKPFNSTEQSAFKEINRFITPRDATATRSFCCRLQISIDDMKKVGRGIFGSAPKVGGVGVFNINLNRVCYVAQGNMKLIKDMLDDLLEISQSLAQKKRKFILDHMDLYPYFSNYLDNLDTYFNIISCAGAHEGLMSMGYPDGLSDPEGAKIGAEIADHIRTRIDMMMTRDRVPVSFEYAPGETANVKMARADLRFQDWITRGCPDTDEFTCFRSVIKQQYDDGVFFDDITEQASV